MDQMETEEPAEVSIPPTILKEPPKIQRLDDSVVNRIAAGEVIQRPVSAVKELVENSLDAGSTSVNVAVKDGGLKLIQVSDDGHGIRYEDLPILCERHTTSKLSKYEDLLSIKSMGFRGEALASMTYVGHVMVTTITKGQLHGYRASYRDGVMENEPKACAAVKGTQIMVENLFYNMIARRKTLQNSSDDYTKIVDLLSRFAIHYTNVSFSCRKHGASRSDVHSIATSSRMDSIRTVYGVSVARNLIKIEASDNDSSTSLFAMDGFISNSNYVAKKTTMVLFINDRLVECSALKRAIEIVYAATLPKASKPFIYMSIVLPPEHVDVNVHPTKREVSLLNLEVIIEKIQSVVESKLRDSDETRTFQEQTVETSPCAPSSTSKDLPSGSKLQKVPVNKMVRTDSSDPAGRLHAYLQTKPLNHLAKDTNLTAVSVGLSRLLGGRWPSQDSEEVRSVMVVAEVLEEVCSVMVTDVVIPTKGEKKRSSVRQRRNPNETADLTSIQELIDNIDGNCHSGLLDIVRNCTYIGMADDVFALLQYNTQLYLANVVNLSKELMYQQALRRFAHFNAIQLSDPAPLSELIILALKEEDLDPESSENDDLKEKIAEMNTELLMQKVEMLEEYFGIKIDTHGNLSRLPVILDQYNPDMDRLPEFVLCLGNDVEWEDEKKCFQVIAAAIGNFYSMHPPLLPNPSGEGLQYYKKRKPLRNLEDGEKSSNDAVTGDDVEMEDVVERELLSEAENAWAQREWSIQHVLFPSMRLFLKPPTLLSANGTFVQSFRKYMTFKDYNRLLLELLRELVKNALHFEEIVSGSSSRLNHIDVKIYNLRPFFNSGEFSRAGFELDEVVEHIAGHHRFPVMNRKHIDSLIIHVAYREVHPMPSPNTNNISVSCITNNVPLADQDNTTYIHTPPDHNLSRHKVQGFDHVCFENVKECSAFKSESDPTSIHKGKIFKHKDEMKKELGVYAMENHFWYRVTRSTTTWYEASCTDFNCQWLVRAVKKCQATHWYNVTENQINSIVDIQAKTCACREWDLEKLPYRHALACASPRSISP
ncbi:hypothetical protein EZV62_022590 [Acer yangbiense]|uniref:DNA mismatch repair protein S5 domain-containing protein n=1 Tax=Acer yangbiense TaxID=1000413 RepID=A0A5C7H900_9ROSI|nr:hypothetical protein EZV62_022590 [Acer yangbiense]